jgi:DnaA family protein
MQQLPLGVRIPDRAVFESFLPARNLQAVEHALQMARGAVTGAAWICGPVAAGKTHLLQAVCARASGNGGRAGYFPLAELAALGVGVLEGLTLLECVCLDDLDRVVGELEWERALFAVLREIQEKDGRLVVAAKAPPALLPFKLPDLGSRFAATAIFQLRELDEKEQREALQLRARLRGFELSDDTSRWLQRRFPRDMRTMYELLDTLDEAALVAQRRLTVPFIRSVLKE